MNLELMMGGHYRQNTSNVLLSPLEISGGVEFALEKDEGERSIKIQSGNIKNRQSSKTMTNL